MRTDHWMMFGTFAQQDVFAYPSPDTYKGVIINANMAAHAPAGLASFLHTKTARATYIVDPLTHAFQHDPVTVSNSEGRPKSSVASLAEAYGEPVSGLVGKRPMHPSDLADAALCDDFVSRCVQFQKNQLVAKMRDTDAAKYLEDDEREVPPYAIVAPYFFMSETTLEEWLPVNLACLRKTSRVTAESDERLFASVVIDQGVLEDPQLREMLLKAYSQCDADGFLLWVDGFDEHAASRSELAALVELARGLRQEGTKEVVNLHGGFFSILAGSALGEAALSGVTHGPEFGEHRSVVPVGGGIPIARYYVPQLHARIRYRDAVRMLGSKGWLESASSFRENVCDCSECLAVLEGDIENFKKFGAANVRSVRRKSGLVRIEFPTPEASKRCLRHYLQRKHREHHACEAMGAAELVRSVSRGYHQFKEVAGLDGVKHLRLWLRAFDRDVIPE